jgi:hypothetical protein
MNNNSSGNNSNDENFQEEKKSTQLQIKVDKDELVYLLFRFGVDMVSDDIELIQNSIIDAIFHKKEFAEIDIRLLKTIISWWDNINYIDKYKGLDNQLYSYYRNKLKSLNESNINDN